MKRLLAVLPALAAAVLLVDDLRLRGVFEPEKVPERRDRSVSPTGGRSAEVKRPRIREEICVRPEAPSRGGNRPSAAELEEAVTERLEHLRERRKAQLEELKEKRRNLTDEQRLAQREAFLEKMRERSTRRLQEFVSRTGLSGSEVESFESTVAAVDVSIREAAESWAQKIRQDGAFNADSRVRFIAEMSSIIGAGFTEMDATLPKGWQEKDGNVNLMEIVGPEALSSVVEALTENGLDDGLQAVGQVMGGPQGGEGGASGPGEGPGEGFEGPDGVQGGPGGVQGGPGGGPGGF